ncbi:MAG: ATP-binding protein [bacterium]
MKTGLRWKILIFFLIVGIVPLVFSTFLIRGQVRVAEDIENSLFALDNSASKIVEHFLLNAQKSIIAQSYVPKNLLPVRDTALHRAYLKRIFRKYKVFSEVWFTDKQGRAVSSYGRVPYHRLKKKDFSDIFTKHLPAETSISNVVDFDGDPAVAVFSKVQTENSFLAAFVNVEILRNILEKVVPYKESFFYLIAPSGMTLFLDKPRPPRAGKFIPVKRSGQTLWKRTVEYNGVKFFEITSPVSGFSGWKICLCSRYEVAFGNLVSSRALGAIFSIVAVLLAAVLAVYFSKRISSPLEELSKGAAEFSGGNLSYRINLRTNDELEVLGNQFDRMAEKLLKIQEGLDEKIRASTRDLSNAYREISVKNERLADADKYKSQFLANMSHELRTPMNAIIGFADLLKDGVYGNLPEKQKEILSKIQRNSNHLLNLINDILDLSKIEAGKIELLPEKFDLKDLIDTVSKETVVPKEEVKFSASCPAGISLIHDQMRLRQVIYNLLSNALKFTKEGSVGIECFRREKVVSIKVSDTGIGIKEEDISKIFQSFQQADASVTKQFQGTGLGLSISKKLVEMMGGWLDVESVFGKGSVFTVNLPYE